MRFVLPLILVFILGGSSLGAADPASVQPPCSPPIGANLEVVAPWEAQILFVDVMKRASEWIAFELAENGAFDTGADIPLDPDGYPLELPYQPADPDAAAQGVFSILFTDMQGHYPAGTYTLSFDGSGLLLLSGSNGEQAFTAGGTYPVQIDPSQGDLYLHLIVSDPDDRIRNIHLVMPGHETTYTTQPFYPPLVERLSDFEAVRFSQTMRTNDGDYPCDNGVAVTDPACEKGWGLRPTTSYYTQATGRGVALEHLIDLANAADVDPWFCIQHGATDEHIWQFAETVRTRLAPGKRFYVELSNELFNYDTPYPQSIWCRDSGLALGLSTDPEEARRRMVAKRSAEMFHIFEQVFQGLTDVELVKVLPGWLADAPGNDAILTAMDDPTLNPSGVQADVLAVGAYFGYMISIEILVNGESQTITVPEILTRARNNLTLDRSDPTDGGIIESLQHLLDENRIVASAHGIGMVAYEGGQHILEYNGWNNDPVLGDKLIAANRDEEMGRIYDRMLDVWCGSGGGLFLHYSLVRRPTVAWGSFGSLEWTTQDPDASPKHRTLRQRAAGQ